MREDKYYVGYVAADRLSHRQALSRLDGWVDGWMGNIADDTVQSMRTAVEERNLRVDVDSV